MCMNLVQGIFSTKYASADVDGENEISTSYIQDADSESEEKSEESEDEQGLTWYEQNGEYKSYDEKSTRCYKKIDDNNVAITQIVGYGYYPKEDEIIVIPDKVKIEGKYYNITSVGDGETSAVLPVKFKKIVLPNTVTRIEKGAFHNAYVDEIVLPDSITHIGGNYQFALMKAKEITIPKNVKTIENLTFIDCYIEKVILSEGLTKIDANNFVDMYKLKEIYIPSTVKNIGYNTFCNCLQLEEIKIPYGVESIEEHCFWYCENLKQVYIPSTVTSIGDNIFIGSSDKLEVIAGSEAVKLLILNHSNLEENQIKVVEDEK